MSEQVFNPAAAAEVDQDTILTADPTLSGKQFPTIQWVNGRQDLSDLGNDNLKYTGGFLFVIKTNSNKKNEQLSDDQIAERKAIADVLLGYEKSPWKTGKYTFHDGTVAEGVWTRQMGITACLRRRAWSVKNDDSQKLFTWDAFSSAKAECAAGKSPSSKEQILVQVKGAESVAPLMLTFAGHGSKAFDEILVQFQNTILTAANAKAKAWADAQKPPVAAPKFAPRCFYLAMGANRNADGSPKFVPAGKGKDSTMITPPVALGMPENASDVDDKLLAFLQVPQSVLAQGAKIVADNQDWIKAWESFDYNNSDAPKPAAKEENVKEQISNDNASKLQELGI